MCGCREWLDMGEGRGVGNISKKGIDRRVRVWLNARSFHFGLLRAMRGGLGWRGRKFFEKK